VTDRPTDRHTDRPRSLCNNNIATYVVRRCGLIIITNGQSNLSTSLIAAAHGRFNGIRQVVPLCTPPNSCFLRPTRVQIRNGIWIGSAVFLHLTAECPYIKSIYTLGRPYSLLKIVRVHGGSRTHLMHSFIGQPESSTQTASRSVQPFLQGSV